MNEPRSNRDVLQSAMAAISSLDTGGVLDLLAPDHVMQLPYESAVDDLDRDGFGALFDTMFAMFRRFTITLTRVYESADPNRLMAEYVGDCIARDSEVTYANHYIGIFEFRDGLITLWREFDNPLISAAMVAEISGGNAP